MEAGYCLTASVIQGERRIILVLNGLDSQKARSEESARLIGWAMREFDNCTLFKPGETVDEAPVWLGEAANVALVMPEGVTVTLSRKARRDMRVTVVYDAPIPAPLRAGQEVARLVINAPGEEPVEFPLRAGTDVERLGVFGRIATSLEYLVFGAQ